MKEIFISFITRRSAARRDRLRRHDGVRRFQVEEVGQAVLEAEQFLVRQQPRRVELEDPRAARRRASAAAAGS